MVADCPLNYSDTSVRNLCQHAVSEQYSNDAILITPVTDVVQNITYANIHCAHCNDISNYKSWYVKLNCNLQQNNIPPATLSHGNTTSSSASQNFSSTLTHVKKPTSSSVSPNNPDIIHFRPRPKPKQAVREQDPSEIMKYAKYDEFTKVFRSFYKGNNYTCKYQKTAPADIIPALRHCVSSISFCPNDYPDKAVSERCISYTAVLYTNEQPHAYKNQHCALCNGNTRNDLLGCSENEIKIGASILFSGTNKSSSPDLNSCIKMNNQLKNKFCP